jgi:hypothetical protein
VPAAEPLPGEAWAYRARQADPLGEVVVMKIGSRRPIRVLVRFVDPSFEGLEDWVPPARLKVLWTDVEAFERPPTARLVRYSQRASYITIGGGNRPQRPTLNRTGGGLVLDYVS